MLTPPTKKQPLTPDVSPSGTPHPIKTAPVPDGFPSGTSRIPDMNTNNLHSIMLAGTGSDVGKSVIATALCRIFLQDGYSPAPFKAQNMALNSAATPDGYEIGRAQAVQAGAARLAPCTDMNPLLLKPNSEHTSQVVLNGKPIGNRDAYDYFRREGRDELRQAVCQAYDRLASRHNPIVMEGAGSISEINLRDTDLVNMPMARYADADVILVADIDRGGVFASAYGSIMLQLPEDKHRIKGIIVNKFRGDKRLFESGRRMLEEICGVPVLGVIPYYKGIHIEEEDSMSLAQKRYEAAKNSINVAVVQLRHLSNFTDFDRLESHPRVNLYYTNNIMELQKADVIILPGTKSTLADLYELRQNGVAEALLRAHREGKRIIGICGGYQMLGQQVCDPTGVEGSIERLPGLGLLPTVTTMDSEKVTKPVDFLFMDSTEICHGYEIHQGRTETADPSCITDAPYVLQGNVLGTYIHGILDNAPVIDWLLRPFQGKAETGTEDYASFKDRQYDLLADHVRAHLDMDKLYEILRG